MKMAREKTEIAITTGIVVLILLFSGLMLQTLADTTPPISPDFSISASPSSLTIEVGKSTTSTIKLASVNSFNGTVALAVSEFSGLSGNLSASSVSLQAGTTPSVSTILTITVPTTISPGVFTSNAGVFKLTIAGTSEQVTHSVDIIVYVVKPDFSISLNPISLTILTGTFQTAAVTLASLGNFNGTIAMTVSNDLGISCTVPSPVQLNWTSTRVSLSEITIAIPLTTAPGTYDLTLNATDGSLTHIARMAIEVVDLPRIFIKNDGGIEPTSTLIQQIGDLFQFSGDLFQLALHVQRDNTILDGTGYTLQGIGKNNYGIGILIVNQNNITIRNFGLTNFHWAIFVLNSSNIKILNCNFTNNGEAITLDRSSNNRIIENYLTNHITAIKINKGDAQDIERNCIANNTIGISLTYSNNNIIIENNFENTNKNIEFSQSAFSNLHGNNFKGTRIVFSDNPPKLNSWNNETEGNYWSDYAGTDADSNGIGDTPYIINTNNIDNYALIDPANFTIPPPIITPSTPTPPASVSPSQIQSPTPAPSSTPFPNSNPSPMVGAIVVFSTIIGVVAILIFWRTSRSKSTWPQN